MDNEKFDRRKITSPQNGKKGGRPRVWNVNPYEYIKFCNAHPSPENKRQADELKEMLARRRKARLQDKRYELSRYHKRPDDVLRQIQHQKDLRKKKLAELRYLRMVTRRLCAQLDALDASDLDIVRTPNPTPAYEPDPTYGQPTEYCLDPKYVPKLDDGK